MSSICWKQNCNSKPTVLSNTSTIHFPCNNIHVWPTLFSCYGRQNMHVFSMGGKKNEWHTIEVVTVSCLCVVTWSNGLRSVAHLHCSSTCLWHTCRRRSVQIFGCLDLICSHLEENRKHKWFLRWQKNILVLRWILFIYLSFWC